MKTSHSKSGGFFVYGKSGKLLTAFQFSDLKEQSEAKKSAKKFAKNHYSIKEYSSSDPKFAIALNLLSANKKPR